MCEGLRTTTDLVVIVVTLLAFGCPVQAIVQAYGLDERTVASWRDRAGKQCQRVHRAIVEQGRLDLVHVQADEIRVKARSMVAWMGLAMMVPTRLWLGGVVSRTRDTHLADRLQALETGMYLIGSTYNFCCFHQQLSTQAAGEAQKLLRQTPAMASGLTDHLWSLSELLRYKVAPAPWVEPKRRGRPRTRPLPDPNVPKRPRGRPRKIPLCTFTS